MLSAARPAAVRDPPATDVEARGNDRQGASELPLVRRSPRPTVMGRIADGGIDVKAGKRGMGEASGSRILLQSRDCEGATALAFSRRSRFLTGAALMFGEAGDKGWRRS
jgi:hypothetical protein